MFESEFESEQVFCNFQSSILTSRFCNFRKIWNFQSSATLKILQNLASKNGLNLGQCSSDLNQIVSIESMDTI